MPISPLNVLVCDELPVVRAGLRSVLATEPDIEVVATTDSGIEALVMARRLRPHVVITDAVLSGLSGIELTRRLQQERLDPMPGVLVFTLRDDDAKIINFLEAGAMGLVIKETGTDQVAAAVRTVAAGEAALAPCVTRKLLNWFFQRESQPGGQVPSAVSSLSPRERQVLQLVARGMSAVEIAKELQIGEATVRTHTYRLRCKLDLRNRAQLVAFAHRFGLAATGPRPGEGARPGEGGWPGESAWSDAGVRPGESVRPGEGARPGAGPRPGRPEIHRVTA